MVTVVIPCHNHGSSLVQAIESATAADRIIVINDHSVDDTRRVAAQFPHVDTINAVGRGVVAARNEAIEQIKDGLIIPLDADDWFTPGGLQALVAAWQPGTFTYGNWIDVFDHCERLKVAPQPRMITAKNICHATMCYSKSDWQSVGGYDRDFEIGCEDWAFALALVQAGITAHKVNQPIYYKAMTQSGRSSALLRYPDAIRQLLKGKYNIHAI